MAYSKFHPDLLRMMYELTKTDRKLYGRELEDYLVTKLGGLSRRTIYRWLKYLKEQENNNYSFDYIPYLDLSSMGLIRVELMIRKPEHPDISLMIPGNYYHFVIRNSSMDEYMNIQSLVPPDKAPDMIGLLEKMLSMDLIEDFSYFRILDVFFIPSPFHEVINGGRIDIPDGIDNSYFINRMDIKRPEIGIDREFHEDPLRMAVIFESDKDMYSYEDLSRILLKSRKDFLGRISNETVDEKHISNRVRRLQHDFYRNGKYQRFMYIYYKYMNEIRERVCLFVYIRNDHNLTDDLKGLIHEISRRTVTTTGFFMLDGKGEKYLKLQLNSTFDRILECLEIIKEYDDEMVYYIMNIERTMEILDREHAKFFYWDHFDPLSVRWKFDMDDYKKRIEKFEKDLRSGNYVPRKTFGW